MKLDTKKTGWPAIFKPYEKAVLDIVFLRDASGLDTKTINAYETASAQIFPDTISRASIIFFLNRMVDAGILQATKGTGKGGHHKVYSPVRTYDETKAFIVREFVRTISTAIPETYDLIKKLSIPTMNVNGEIIA